MTIKLSSNNTAENNNKINLIDMHPGDSAIIKQIDKCSPDYRQRLTALGLCRNRKMQVIRKRKSTIQIRINGTNVILRLAEICPFLQLMPCSN